MCSLCLRCVRGSDSGEGGGPGEVPDPADGVPLQGDRTAGHRQVGLPPGLRGPQRRGTAPSARLEQDFNLFIFYFFRL